MVVMMNMEISCKGHCEKLSHFLDHMSHTVLIISTDSRLKKAGSPCLYLLFCYFYLL